MTKPPQQPRQPSRENVEARLLPGLHRRAGCQTYQPFEPDGFDSQPATLLQNEKGGRKLFLGLSNCPNRHSQIKRRPIEGDGCSRAFLSLHCCRYASH